MATAIADTVVAAGAQSPSRTTLDASWVALDDATVTKRDDLAKELATTTRVATVTTNDTAHRCSIVCWRRPSPPTARPSSRMRPGLP